MINIRIFQCNMLQENCYVVSDESNDAVVIDPGAFFENERKAISQYISENGLQLRHVLCTHGHFDHLFGAGTLYRDFGIKPELNVADQFLYDAAEEQATEMLGANIRLDMPPTDASLTDGERISFGTHQFTVLATPGHSPGGVCFYCAEENVVFTGDTLFRMSVGRTDLHQGSWPALMQSLKKTVATLPAATIVYPGHGPKTSIQDELAMNPFMN